MSENRAFYARWLQTAREDHAAAQWNLKGEFFSQVCYLCQQAVEKALKAYLYLQGERDVWGHSVETLTKKAGVYDARLEEMIPEMKKMDRFYIPTRYPNGLPEGTPHQNYTRADADFALRIAGGIIETLSGR